MYYVHTNALATWYCTHKIFSSALTWLVSHDASSAFKAESCSSFKGDGISSTITMELSLPIGPSQSIPRSSI